MNRRDLNLFAAGFCAFAFFDSSLRGDAFGAAINAIFAALNLWYALRLRPTVNGDA